MTLRHAGTLLGLGAVGAAVSPPVHDLAETSLAWHMAQHAALSVIGPPLLVLSRPHLLLPLAIRRPTLRVLHRAAPVASRPEPVLAVFAAVLVAIHLPGGVRLAESSSLAHAGEHAVLLVVSLAFWAAVLGAAPWPRRSAARRFACLLLAMPPGDAVGVWLVASGGSGYEGVSPAGARAAGVVMLAASIPLALAAAAVAWQAISAEERRRRRQELLHAAR
jgi:cytochrome c oxidase assembly factor CtaG